MFAIRDGKIYDGMSRSASGDTGSSSDVEAVPAAYCELDSSNTFHVAAASCCDD